MTEFSPKTNTHLFGHDEAWQSLLREQESGKLPHGLIIGGPRGIGKATFAYRLARTLLGDSKRIASGAHADLLVIEPVFDEKKEEYAREISVEQARGIGQFLSLTPAEGTHRVVIVDSIDQLNANAANAILKVLEEPPPQAVLILVSHMPGSLLPTIRSRCRMLKLKPPSAEDFAQVLRLNYPNISEDKQFLLGELTDYAPGLAAQFEAQDAATLYQEILALVATLPATSGQELFAFAESVAPGHERMALLAQLVLCLFRRAAKQAAGQPIRAISPQEQQALATLATLHSTHGLAAKWQQAQEQFFLAERRHLDYKSVIIAFFHSIASKESGDMVA